MLHCRISSLRSCCKLFESMAHQRTAKTRQTESKFMNEYHCLAEWLTGAVVGFLPKPQGDVNKPFSTRPQNVILRPSTCSLQRTTHIRDKTPTLRIYGTSFIFIKTLWKLIELSGSKRDCVKEYLQESSRVGQPANAASNPSPDFQMSIHKIKALQVMAATTGCWCQRQSPTPIADNQHDCTRTTTTNEPPQSSRSSSLQSSPPRPETTQWPHRESAMARDFRVMSVAPRASAYGSAPSALLSPGPCHPHAFKSPPSPSVRRSRIRDVL